MSARIETVRSPSRAEPPPPGPMLLRRLAMVFLVGLIGGVGLSFIGLANRTIAPAAFALTSSCSIGLLAGFTSRRALRGHTLALRGVSAIAAVIVSLLFVGWMSGGDVGLVIPRRPPAAADWGGLLELAAGALGASLVLLAWRGEQRRTNAGSTVPTARGPRPSNGRPAESRAPTPLAARRRTRARAVHPRTPEWAARPGGLAGSIVRRISRWRTALPRLGRRVALPGWSLPSWLARRPGLSRRARVRLLGVEEHRCPYCLDVVERADPRGVVTCKICRTRHHADCWAMTGMCQVPHVHR